MSTTVAYADVNDGYIIARDPTYNGATSTSPAIRDVLTSNTTMQLGQNRATQYEVHQSFVQHNHVTGDVRTAVSAYMRFTSNVTQGTGVVRNLEMAALDFGSEVNASDYRSRAQLGTLFSGSLVGQLFNLQNVPNGVSFLVGAPGVQVGDFDVANSPRRNVVFSSRNRLGNVPTGAEITALRTADFEGTASDPVNITTWARKSLIDMTMGAQVQLSDGTFVYAVQDSAAPIGAVVRMYRYDGSTHTQLGSFTVATRRSGLQSLAMCRDEDDNVYVAISNNATASNNRVSIRALVKSGSSWTLSANQAFDLASYSAAPNNMVMAWHPVGAGGTLLLITAPYPGYNDGIQMRWALVNAQTVRAGSGVQVRARGDAENGLMVRDTSGFHFSYANETGTLMDLCPVLGTNGGFFMCTTRNTFASNTGRQSLSYYEITSNAQSINIFVREVDSFSGFSVKDASAKSRCIALDPNGFVTANASSSIGFGLVVKYRRRSGSSLTTLADVRLHSEGITSLPTEQNFALQANWDVVHSPLDNRVWVYYFDVNNGRRLLRTDVSLTTGLAGLNVVEVATDVGPSGSENVHLRVHRGQSTGDRVLVTVGNTDASNNYSVIYIDDQLNAAPNAPILTQQPNYDAVNAAQFDWTFSDPNSGDSQSAYQFELRRVSDDTVIIDTDKVIGTNQFHSVPGGSLVNGETYQWRVRTWDQSDEVGPYSGFSQFTTSNTGVVNITYPPTDNDPSIITASFLLQWTVTGATQAQYRIRVYRTLDETLLQDTGWVASAALSHQLSGLESDVEHRIELQVRDALLVESNVATVLVTPSYNRPEVPIVTVTSFPDEGYIRIDVSNPEPQGDRPNPTSNEVYRRKVGENISYLVGTIPPNSFINDYEAASRTQYEFWARAGVES